jgi:hypothetical protein
MTPSNVHGRFRISSDFASAQILPAKRTAFRGCRLRAYAVAVEHQRSPGG